MRCPLCRSANPESKRYCGDCGAPLPQRCVACGADNPASKRFCGDCGAALPASATTAGAPTAERMASDAERRQLTVMFCDLVDSTAIARQLDPEDLREVIAAFHRCVAETVNRFDGFVAKYMGDGVLAYFGYPQAHEDDAERAVRAGLALVETISRLATPVSAGLAARIGIATGLVVVGDLVGMGEAQERGVVGETPNLAARLQALAAPGGVVIAASTRRLVGGLFECLDLGATEMKGFNAPVRAHKVLRPCATQDRFEALHAAAALTPIVGREEEIDLLLRRWAQAKAGEGRVVLITGDPGIGKSRLVADLQDRLLSESHVRLRYFSSPFDADSVLQPIIGQLTHAAKFERDDSAETRFLKLEDLLLAATPSSDDIGVLAELLALPTTNRRPAVALGPQQRKEKTFAALMRQLDGLARRQPVLVVFEDVHWIDPTSLELLSLLNDRAPGLPVLVIVTSRPEFKPPWLGQAHVTLLSLNRLGRQQSAEIASRIAERKVLPPEVLAQIVARTDGVPLFVEELTKTVLESGMLRAVGDHYELHGSLQGLAIPTSLQASLVARLDRLDWVKEVAQIAAAIGREFSHDLLAAVTGLPEDQVREALQRLVAAELVYQRGSPPEATYSFKHALVQDAAYSTLLRGRRRRIHADIKKALEERAPDLVETQPELLAHHCAEAGLAEEAVRHFERAGLRAVQRSANREATGHLQRALELLKTLPDDRARGDRELRLLVALGPALMTTTTSSAPDVDRVYARARQLARQFDRSSDLFPAIWGSWMVAYTGGDIVSAQRLVDELFALAHAESDSGFLLQAHHAACSISRFSGDLLAARRHIAGTVAAYRREIHGDHAFHFGGHDPCVCAHTLDAAVLAVLGFLDQGRDRAKQAMELARELAHPPTIVHALTFGVDYYHLRRDVRTLGEFVDELLPLVTEFGSPVGIANATMLRGWVQIMRGEAAEGVARLRVGVEAWRATGSRLHRPYRLARAAEALDKAGFADEAWSLLEEASAVGATVGDHWFDAELNRLKGDLSMRSSTPDTAAAEACYEQALRIARQQSARLFELRTCVSFARLRRNSSGAAAARDRLVSVYECFSEGLDAPDLREARELLDALA